MLVKIHSIYLSIIQYLIQKIAIVKLWGVVDLQPEVDNLNIDVYNGKLCASDIYIEEKINYFDLIPYFLKFVKTQRGEFDFLVWSHDKLISDIFSIIVVIHRCF